MASREQHCRGHTGTGGETNGTNTLSTVSVLSAPWYIGLVQPWAVDGIGFHGAWGLLPNPRRAQWAASQTYTVGRWSFRCGLDWRHKKSLESDPTTPHYEGPARLAGIGIRHA